MKSFDLIEFNRGLIADVVEGRRPKSHLLLTGCMREILREFEARKKGKGDVTVYKPADRFYKQACEELVTLGRLSRLPHEQGYEIITRM